MLRNVRADARRNTELLLQAAQDVFLERGPDGSLEEIARRAGVGIATLYRRFGDRQALLHAVVQAALVASADAADQARREQADPFDALAAYVHAVLDLRTSAVISALLDRLDLAEPELDAARRRSSHRADQLLAAAREAGAIRKDVTFGDVGLILVRLSRPLPGPIPAETQCLLAHRHADLLLRGLRALPSDEPLPGPALELADLRRLRRRARTAPTGS
jgi:AcrR family transcriptional regulator